MNIDTDLISLLADLATALGLLFTAYQVRKGARTSQGQFLLHLDQQFSDFDDIYIKIRRAHESDTECTAFNEDELLRVREYMGFLEIVEILLQGGSISEKDFKAVFGHRVVALVKNREIMHATVKKAPEKWRYFIQLANRFNLPLG